MLIKNFVAGTLCVFAMMGARAHQIWIEPAGKTYILHFGEYDENLKEASPGLLDKLPAPLVKATIAGKLVAIDASRQENGFSLDANKADNVVAEVRNYPVFEKKVGKQVTRGKWVSAARYVSSLNVQSPISLLDIVPTGSEGRFAVYFRGKPLPKTKVTLVAPNGWQKALQTNDRGEVEVNSPWRGVYLLEVVHKENIAGELGGEAYDSASFTSTLTFEMAKGEPTFRPKAANPSAAAY